jgi:glycerol-1-phosphate dehydrogenase [NAD(P)+]
MPLRFDPGSIERFKADIRAIPGYPAGEELPIRAMIFESGAVFRLPEFLQLASANPARPVLVVMDETPMWRAADDLKSLILTQLRAAGWTPEPLWLEPDGTGQVHTDFGQIGRVKARLQPDVAVLSVGSGAVTDIAKHACHVYQQEHNLPPLPYVVYQTANSVSAYTSNMAPTFVDGVKRTLASRYPDVLVCDLETLCDAPYEMTVAGVGDLLAAFGSYADWWLACRLGLDPTYTEFAQTLMGPLDEIFLAEAQSIRARTLEGMSVLAKLIALGGLAMALSHATAPLSGYEHVISHVLDLIAEQSHRSLAQHGTQVALATLLTTSAYQAFFRDFDPAQVVIGHCYPTEASMRARIEAVFNSLDPSGRVAAECWSDYGHKLALWHDRRAVFEEVLRDWPGVRAKLEALTRPPELAARILQAVDSPVRFEQLAPPPTEAEVKFAFAHGPLIRRRMTFGDLIVFLGWDQQRWWARVNEHLTQNRSNGGNRGSQPSHA